MQLRTIQPLLRNRLTRSRETDSIFRVHTHTCVPTWRTRIRCNPIRRRVLSTWPSHCHVGTLARYINVNAGAGTTTCMDVFNLLIQTEHTQTLSVTCQAPRWPSECLSSGFAHCRSAEDVSFSGAAVVNCRRAANLTGVSAANPVGFLRFESIYAKFATPTALRDTGSVAIERTTCAAGYCRRSQLIGADCQGTAR